MTTMFEREIECSQCGVKSRQTFLGSTNTMGAPDLDLRPAEMQRSTMSTWTQYCPTCGLVADDLTEAKGDVSGVLQSAIYRRILTDAGLPPLASRFWCAALIHEATGSMMDAFRSMLCAAWAADDANADELARECRRHAVDHVTPYEGADMNMRIRLLDVTRRAALWDKADGMVEALSREELPGVLPKIVAFEAQLISARDDRCYRVDDALA